MNASPFAARVPLVRIDATDAGATARCGRTRFDLSRDFRLVPAGLESYAFASWQPVHYDAMVVAACIEFADRSSARPRHGWAREFQIRVPVHDVERWRDRSVVSTLTAVLQHLTGDAWKFDFVRSRTGAPIPDAEVLALQFETKAVIPFSDGLDSCAVAGLVGHDIGNRLLRVRMGSKAIGRPTRRDREPFAQVPYSVRAEGEASARSRGFKFAMIAAIAASLCDADEIIIAESAQGVFGPALATTAHAYADYRSHPLFTSKMTTFLGSLFKRSFRFSFPRLWHTKAETLREYARIANESALRSTRSCWMSQRLSSVEGVHRQCGVCAACMLRRLSLQAAGIAEDPRTYVCENLHAPSLDVSAAPTFRHLTKAFRAYAFAGSQHLFQVAALAHPSMRGTLARHAVLVAECLDQSCDATKDLLASVLERHCAELDCFLNHLGPQSFVNRWGGGSRG